MFPTPCVSHITCHMSWFNVKYIYIHICMYFSFFIFLYKVVELVGEKSFNNGAYPVFFKPVSDFGRVLEQGSSLIRPLIPAKLTQVYPSNFWLILKKVPCVQTDMLPSPTSHLLMETGFIGTLQSRQTILQGYFLLTEEVDYYWNALQPDRGGLVSSGHSIWRGMFSLTLN